MDDTKDELVWNTDDNNCEAEEAKVDSRDSDWDPYDESVNINTEYACRVL